MGKNPIVNLIDKFIGLYIFCVANAISAPMDILSRPSRITHRTAVLNNLLKIASLAYYLIPFMTNVEYAAVDICSSNIAIAT